MSRGTLPSELRNLQVTAKQIRRLRKTSVRLDIEQRLLLPGLIARGGGHVVTLGSVAGEFAYPGGSVYAASKAFVKHFALAIRSDLQGKNVRVTDIEPGLTETEFSVVRFKGDEEKAGNVYAGTKAMNAEDIAESIFWATSLPEHVNINKIQLMATTQAIGPFIIHREG